MDKTLNLTYALGLIVGLILAAVILTVMSKTRNKDGKLRMEYDERQKADRNASFAAGFAVLVVLDVLMAALRQSGVQLPFDPVVEALICCLTAASVSGILCIHREAWLSLREKPGKTVWLLLLLVLVIGVNGVGKTTTIGKLANQLRMEGKKVLLCAADTFRAAAADQLTIWAQRAGADIVRHAEGADPSAVIFDAITAAKARGCDVVICDTAGRLHNKQNLMNELEKMRRVINRELPEASVETLLVLDATTGQNAISQAEGFNSVTGLTGLVITKLDGTAKGGIAIHVSSSMQVPVKFIGVGEQVDDLLEFDALDFTRAFFDEKEAE